VSQDPAPARTPENITRDYVRLPASRDKISGHGVFPRIPDTSPAASRYEAIILSDTAILHSYTIIHPNPKSGEPPFVVVYADFPEDTRVFGRLIQLGGERPRIGMQLRTVRPAANDGDAEGYEFVPAEERAA
jgi:uncharacterized OB-fold protein